jgi:GT2 family glycosyltransferase
MSSRHPVRKVSVCVLSWNGRRHLETCLPALRVQTSPGIDWEVLVLDNGSKDGTADWVRAEHPWVSLYESTVNTGFCSGNNYLASRAEGDAVVFLNNDTRPEKGWLKALVAALEEAPDDVAAVSGRIVDWEGELLDFARGVMTFDGHAFQLDHGRRVKEARLVPEGGEILFPCGGNMIVRKASFQRAGGFDDDYFAYLEDVDLGWRLWSGGERVIATARAVVRHRSAATSELLGLYNRGFLFERNAFLTAYKNFEDGLWERMMPAVLLTLLSRTQTLLVQNNPGTETLTLDPYAGHIANTAGKEAEALQRPAPTPPGAGFLERAADRWRDLGPVGFVRRVLEKIEEAFRKKPPPEHPTVRDDRTIAQLRVQTWVLAHLASAAEKRAAVQKRRKRSDAEIFERFPLWVVPTYPGDDPLFASEGFRAWLPGDLRFEHAELADVMAVDEKR